MRGFVASYLNVCVVKIAAEVDDAGGFLRTIENVAPLAAES